MFLPSLSPLERPMEPRSANASRSGRDHLAHGGVQETNVPRVLVVKSLAHVEPFKNGCQEQWRHVDVKSSFDAWRYYHDAGHARSMSNEPSNRRADRRIELQRRALAQRAHETAAATATTTTTTMTTTKTTTTRRGDPLPVSAVVLFPIDCLCSGVPA